MKKLLILSMLISVCLSCAGCSWVVKVEKGKYVCKTPYITYTEMYNVGDTPDENAKHPADKIEINQKVYTGYATGGRGGENRIYYYKKPEDIYIQIDESNYPFAEFEFEYNKKTKQLILIDVETGNVYHLDKVE